jgi:hypothetical protein
VLLPSDPSHDDATGLLAAWADRSLDAYVLTHPDGSTWSFSAHVTGFSNSAPVDGHLSADVTLRPSGAPSSRRRAPDGRQDHPGGRAAAPRGPGVRPRPARPRLFEEYAAGDVSYAALAERHGLAEGHVRAILTNRLYNGWSVRHRRSADEVKVPAPWRDDPLVSDPLKLARERGGEAERANLVASAYDRVVVTDKGIVEVELTEDAMRHGLAIALRSA